MKTILGLDLGVTSIGWALIELDENNIPVRIIALGARIIPLSTEDNNEFTSGNAISKNKKRTEKRTGRKGYDRYQLRRAKLSALMKALDMLPDEVLINTSLEKLWNLRSKAVNEQISLQELGRVLYHLNQKRGYKHAKADESSNDKKQKDYVATINNRYDLIKSVEKTVGEYFYDKLKENEIKTEKGTYFTFRIKENVFPRKAYVEEYDKIMEFQKQFYPEILKNEIINQIRDEIIFYQRDLKSCKHLISICEFEKKAYLNKEGKTVFDGPKVAPRSSPLFQVSKIWESVNNLTLKNRQGASLNITMEQRQALFDHLDNNEKLTITDMYSILGIKKSDGWWGGKAIGKGLQGNLTKIKLKKALVNQRNADDLLKFELNIIDSKFFDDNTGEVLRIVSPEFENEPLFQLWHTLYSIKNKPELIKALNKKFGINDEEIINNLYKIDFAKEGYGNKSSKAIRKIIPYLQEGKMYSEACLNAGFRHSESLTKEENEERELSERLELLKKNELRQPIVEKILNQMINLVNTIIDEYGKPNEVRVELARELKQSKEERNTTFKNISLNERENKRIEQRIAELGLRSSKNRIQKYKMWEESLQKCFYCGTSVNVNEFLKGFDVEKEHIIPKSLLFDNSYSNTVCACRKCNAEKSNKTAYDYMKTKSEEDFQSYLRRVEDYHKNGKISKTKRDRLLASYEDYLIRKKKGEETDEDKKLWEEFIERQLRESQYIAKKAKDILKNVCRKVNTTSGSVTDYIRHCWGWDEILHDLNFERYKSAGLTEWREFEHRGQTHKKEKIKEWSKRLDHRHHAVDALVVACTTQSIIQRLNNLSALKDKKFSEFDEQSDTHKEKQVKLEKWLNEQEHFTTESIKEKVNEILISYKAGKKAASTGKRYKYVNGKKEVLQEGIIIPRGALSEESVYGKIRVIEKKPIKYLFENPDLIVNESIKKTVLNKIKEYNGDIKSALNSLKKEPIYLNEEKGTIIESGSCFKEEYVIKYNLKDIKEKDVSFIVDKKIQYLVRKRLQEFNNNEKEAFKDLERNPLFYDEQKTIPIKSVRCFTGLKSVEPVKKNKNKEPIGFVVPGNNHHIAIYTDNNGNKVEHAVTFWHAVERKKHGIPIIIQNPEEVWDSLFNREFPQAFLRNLPDVNLKFELSLQQNDMFVLGLPQETLDYALAENDYKTISSHLYKVQNLSEKQYRFNLHTQTQFDTSFMNKNCKRFYNLQSIDAFYKLNPRKVKINLLGKIERI